MADWNGLPPDPSNGAFHWLHDNRRKEELPCRWVPCDKTLEDGHWKLWGSLRAWSPKDVASTHEYVAEVMTTKKADKLSDIIMMHDVTTWNV